MRVSGVCRWRLLERNPLNLGAREAIFFPQRPRPAISAEPVHTPNLENSGRAPGGRGPFTLP